MNLNQDQVPSNLDEAVSLVIQALSVDEKAQIKESVWPVPDIAVPFMSRGVDDKARIKAMTWHTVVEKLACEWSISDNNSRLVRWFKTTYGVEKENHVCQLILVCACDDVRGQPRHDKTLAKALRDCREKGGIPTDEL